MTGEWTQDDVLARFVALTKIARLMQRRANRADPAELMSLGEAFAARERAIGYTAECIAQELHKREPQVFTSELQARFKAVGDIIDRQIDSGPIGVDKRRALIERAVPYLPFSPGVLREPDEDDDAIARALNGKASEMVSYIYDREIGVRRPLPVLVDRPFNGHDARRLADWLGSLNDEVHQRLTTVDFIFSEPEHDDLGFFSHQIERELEGAFQIVHSRPSDPTLARVDQRMQAAIREISDDLSSSPEDAPASVTTSPRDISSRRRKHGEISSSDELPQMDRAALHRRLGEPGQSSTSSVVLAPRGEAVDARENLVVDGQAANLRQSDRPRLQAPDEGVGSIAPSGRRSEPINQRPPRERQRNRSGGLEY